MKVCAMCQEERPLSEFGKDSRMTLGVKSYCRGCCSADAKRRFQANPEHHRALKNAARKRRYTPEWGRQRHLWAKYGLTWEQYQKLLVAQDHRCAICNATEPGGRGNWHVDHNHETGVVRGLLCSGCNVGLGMFQESEERLRAAVEYLARFQ